MKLVRGNSFAEWITVYFDPEKITEEKLLKLLHERRCKSSEVDRGANDEFMAMNPFVCGGEVVQLKVPDGEKKPVQS